MYQSYGNQIFWSVVFNSERRSTTLLTHRHHHLHHHHQPRQSTSYTSTMDLVIVFQIFYDYYYHSVLFSTQLCSSINRYIFTPVCYCSPYRYLAPSPQPQCICLYQKNEREEIQQHVFSQRANKTNHQPCKFIIIIR